MSEMRELLVDTATRQFADLCTNAAFDVAETGSLDLRLWQALEDTGLAAATRSEARGGAGADLGDALAVVREAGSAGLPAPLAETLIAELMLASASLPPLAGPLSVGPVLGRSELELKRANNAWQLHGTMKRIPWGRHAHAVVALAEYDGKNATVVVQHPAVSRQSANYAREPRDTMHFDGLLIPDGDVSLSGSGMSVDQLQVTGALFRSVAMAGALFRTLQTTVEYAMQRQQFGRPIGKFQAIQQQVAILASQVAAANAAADAAVEAATHDLAAATFEIAAAKTRVGEAAGIAAAIAHQVHGAMGFSYEYSLQRSTRRLWSWRDEFGSEAEWAAWIGKTVARVGGRGLWAFVTSPVKNVSSAKT